MNKKIVTFLLIAALAVCIVCFASCKENNHAEEMRIINTLLLREYKEIEIDVTTTLDEITLKGEYDVERASNGKTEISYSLERLNQFTSNNGQLTAPEEIKSTVTGKAVFEGKHLVSVDGAEVNYDEVFEIVEMNLAFRVSYFSDVKATENSFAAKVVNPKGFLQNINFEATDMDVKVIYNRATLSSIVINYKAANGAAVTLDYAFSMV